MSRPVGPYTPVVRAGEWLVCSGQLGLKDGRLVEGGVAAQVAQAVTNVASLLAGERAGIEHVVKTTVFLADIGDYPAMNEAYSAAFDELCAGRLSRMPARSAFAVAGLPLGALVEIEAWAWVG